MGLFSLVHKLLVSVCNECAITQEKFLEWSKDSPKKALPKIKDRF